MLTSRRFNSTGTVEFTGPTANAIMDGADFALRAKEQLTRVLPSHSRHSYEAEIKNESGEDLELGEVVGLREPLQLPDEFPESRHSETKWRADLPDIKRDCGRFAIIGAPVRQNEMGLVTWRGECWAYVFLEDESADIRRCDVEDGERQWLRKHAAGSAQILWAPDETGLQLCNIDIQGMRDAFVWGTASGDIVPGDGGQVKVFGAGASGDYLIDVAFTFLAESDISDGTTVGVTWLSHLREWHVTHAECEE